MTEVSSRIGPELEEPAAAGRVKRLASRVGNKALDLLGRDTVLSTKERLISAGGLGAVAVGSTIAQYKFGHELKNSPFPIGFLVYSGRHFVAGNVLAARVGLQSRFNNFVGIMAASMVGDVAAEAGQAGLFTGYINHGWGNVGDFLLPKEIIWGNAKDAAAALLAGGAVYARKRMVEKKSQEKMAAEVEPEFEPTVLAAD